MGNRHRRTHTPHLPCGWMETSQEGEVCVGNGDYYKAFLNPVLQSSNLADIQRGEGRRDKRKEISLLPSPCPLGVELPM